jgi:two-component system cell cycle response regulator DivK
VKTILIVEDNELNIDLLVQILEERYVLLVARDGAQAVRMAGECALDLVLMDISLPIVDGYEATRQIRRLRPDLPVIGLSSHAMQGDADAAYAAGCIQYMTKPVDEELLLDCLRAILG